MSTSVHEQGPPPEAAAAQLLLQLSTGHMMASALRSALIFGIPDRLADGPRPVADLARESGANEDALYRVLRALASIGVFAEPAPRTFALTLPSQMLRSAPGSFRGLARWLTDPTNMRVHAEMHESVKTGAPSAERVLGMPVFEYFATHGDVSEIFNDAMTSFSAAVIPAVLEAYDFTGIGTLVDVAGGHGEVLTSILQANRGMRGVLFDLDHVVAGAGPLIASKGVSDRCETASGDFFTEVPDGDAFILKHIIHDWDDDRAVRILQNIRTRIAGHPDGRVILLESVIAPGSGADGGKIIDLEMLVMAGGRERTAEEFAAVFARAGLALTRIVPTKSALSVIEARVA